MNSHSNDIRAVLEADAREHGVELSLEENAAPPKQAVLDAVHHALLGVELAQIEAGELVVTVGARRDHEVEVQAHLKA